MGRKPKQTKVPAEQKRLLPKVEERQENVQCDLTETNIAELGRQQTKILAEIEKIQADLRTANRDAKYRISAAQAKLKEISERIRDGHEVRSVPVTVTVDYEADTVTFRRNDTGQIYDQRPLNKEERQFVMELQADAATE